jgi:DNA polymerase IIIc chi subunit
MEIGFYHLTRSTLEQALPRLLARVLAIPARAMVLSGAAERLEALDTALWAAAEWLPHGSPATGDAALQPIWLTSEDGAAPNDAAHLFLVDGAESARVLCVWDMMSLVCVAQLQNLAAFADFQWCPRTNQLAAACGSRTVYVWTEDGQLWCRSVVWW